MSEPIALDAYATYRGLPPLAGVTTMADAARPGLSVEQCVGRLKRYHYAFKRLHQIFTARITAEPVYELKTAFGLHAWLCAEHVQALRARVGEMREPPLGLDAVPDPNLELFFDEILASPTTAELILGAYEKAVPALAGALERHVADTNVLADHPSVRLCRMALLELNDMLDFGRAAVAALVGASDREGASDWLALLDAAVAAAGGLDGTADPSGAPVARVHSATPYAYDGVPRRDERFIDPFNRGVDPESFLYDPAKPADAKALMLLFKRLREIDVPEMMASIITQTPDKPWAYYREMSRQLWDEARHAMMGEVGLVAAGVDWRRIPVSWTWSRNLNAMLTPTERHGVLFWIEQSLMPKTGKRYEWEVATQSGHPLAALFQDYDWADEVLHAAIGRRWYVSEFPNPKDASRFGEAAWAKVPSADAEFADRSLSDHRNWWPEVYAQACRARGVEPDPEALAYPGRPTAPLPDVASIAASG
jgi:hypothetical protein